MISRIVKLDIKDSCTKSFEDVFYQSKDTILSFNGCLELSLHRDSGNPNCYFTISLWQDEASLNLYRNSDFFKQLWPQTKLFFNSRAQAWTLQGV